MRSTSTTSWAAPGASWRSGNAAIRKWVEKGTMTEKKAQAELELMRSLVEFLVHCVFKAVTRGAKSP